MDLRTRLRVETMASHERVDRLFSSLSFCSAVDYRHFLAAHLLAFGAIASQRQYDDPGEGRAPVRSLVSALDADLKELGCNALPALANGRREWRVEASDYIVLGSRLGSKLLARRWAEGGQTRARRYLDFRLAPRTWNDFCAVLAERPAAGEQADAIVRDADSLFGLMVTAFNTAGSVREPEAVHA